MIFQLRFLLCCFILVQLNNGVDSDYFYEPALRTRLEATCNSRLEKVYCQLNCRDKSAVCIANACYCVSLTIPKKKYVRDNRAILPEVSKVLELNDALRMAGRLYADLNDYDARLEPELKRRNVEDEEDSLEYLDSTLLAEDKPILRHHIAHFCPNLDVARACIRTCMKEGKPAFCGKDHVCYCGHKYSDTDRDPQVNASQVYADFQDMYEKYFGPNYRPQISA